ncbi:MAG: DUF1045 domain-containing protein [Alphaproteobacteria bacterium]|nr:DUF1045 domain-containing protein [Alphaproteobacteria bacterium]NNF23330.1 DUF1045 domain-containing protein [Paracoccaceae bacterium]
MYDRYAVYVTPRGGLAKTGAAWLGWDLAAGRRVAQPEVPGLDASALTQTPRKYGLHGTLKPPFHLAQGRSEAELQAALSALCRDLAPIALEGLEVAEMSGFVALRPIGDKHGLATMAARIVEGLDAFRAPSTAAEVARRRAAPLTPEQDRLLRRWGYPYVMGAFRFHMTLTGPVPPQELGPVRAALAEMFAPVLPQPFAVEDLVLAGQGADGMFRQISRHRLGT